MFNNSARAPLQSSRHKINLHGGTRRNKSSCMIRLKEEDCLGLLSLVTYRKTSPFVNVIHFG